MFTEYEKAISGLNFNHFNTWRERQKMVRKYSWGILTGEAIRKMNDFGPFIEIGSGNGYWSYEMKRFGIDVIPTDKFNIINNPYDFQPIVWDEVFQVDAVTAVKNYAKERSLLTVWPSYKQNWHDHALRFYHKFGGQTVVFCGESKGGCTGSDRFHDRLSKFWNKHCDIDIPSWGGIHDSLTVWKRK